MRWLVLLVLVGCYEHHLLDREPDVALDVGIDARIRDAGTDVVTRDAGRDVGPPCEREWFDEEVAAPGRDPVLYMHEGGDVDVLFQGEEGLQRARRLDGSWSLESVGIAPRGGVYAFDRNADAVFAGVEEEPRTTLLRVDRDGTVELIGDPRFGGMDALWTSFTDVGTVLTWRQNIVQFAWCLNGPSGWSCEEEDFEYTLENGHAISDPMGRRVHAGRFDRASDFEVRWGSSRWLLDVPNGEEPNRTFSRVRATRERVDAFVTTDLCGIHHVWVTSPEAEPAMRMIEVCPRDGRFALARGPRLHIFTREDDTAFHLAFEGEWSREPVPATLMPGVRGNLSGDAMLSPDGWLGLAYLVTERDRTPSVRLLSSPPCD